MGVLKETNFSWLGKKRAGKVRDVYEQNDRIVLVTTDRHSSFDRIIAHIPRKGAVLNQLSAFWFEKMKDIVPNHIIAVPDQNVTVAKKTTPLPIEAVVRGYITGVTGTSLWTHYQNGKRDFGNFTLPESMQKNQKLPIPVFTPSTKEDTHDRTLSPQEIIAEGIMKKDLLDKVEKAALALFARGQEHAASRGLILVDTKYEFGQDQDGNLMLIDEVHTPDSSRYWYAPSYEERFSKGEEPEYFDKEFLRLWFMKNCDPYKDATLPEAPVELVEELSRRYLKIYRELTGEELAVESGDILERLEKNLKSYAI